MAATKLVIEGRLVGECLEGSNLDFNNQPMFFKSGAKKGEPRTAYYVKVAIPKTHPNWPAIKAACYAAGKEGYPALFRPDGTCINSLFSWKFEDGDSTRPDGTDISQKDGYAGHYVMKANAPSRAPGLYVLENGKPEPCGVEAFKRGYYVAVEIDIEANPGSDKPGIFVNLVKVLRTGFGPEIVSGKPAAEVFAGISAPAGATSVPVVAEGSMPVTPTPGAPKEGFHNVAPAAPAPAAPAPVVATPQSRLIGTMAQYKYEDLLAQNWTEELLVAQGHMSPDELPY